MTSRVSLLLFGLACAAAPGCGDATEDRPDVEELIAAHARTQPPLPSAIRMVHELRDGGRRALVTTSIRSEPFAYREDTVLLEPPGQPLAKVTDGRLAWGPRAGLSGEPLQGEHARGFLVRAFVEGRLYLRPEWRARAGKPFAAGLPADATLPPELAASRDVVQLDCPTVAALTARLQFAADDHRLLGHAEPHLDRGAFTRYGGWQRHGDLLLPSLRVSVWRNPDRLQTFVLRDVQLDPELDPALFAGHPRTGGPGDGGALRVAAGGLPGAAWILAEECSVNGRGVGPALIDTGASTSGVVKALASELRLPPGGLFSMGTFVDRVRGHKVWVDRLQWGPRRALQVTALTGNVMLAPEILPADTPRVVLGGEELLADGPVIDLEAGRLSYRGTPVTSLRALEDAREVVEIPARRDRPGSPCLYLPVMVQGVELLALLDTGFGGTLFLTAAAAERAGVPRHPDRLGSRDAFAQEVGGFGTGTRMDLMLTLEAFDLGPLRFSDVWAQVQMEPGADDQKRSYEALVGAGALLSFPRFGIDTGRDVLELVLPDGVAAGPDGIVRVPPAGAFSGMLLRATDEDRPPVVHAVMPGSPAERAGVRVGDRIVTFDGELLASQDLPYLLRRTWLQPGGRLVLNLFREGEDRPRQLVLRAGG